MNQSSTLILALILYLGLRKKSIWTQYSRDARDLPILQLIVELRYLLQKWFANRKQQALSMTIELTT